MEHVSDKIWVVAVWSPFEAESEIAARIIGIGGGKVFGNLIYGSFPGFPLKPVIQANYLQLASKLSEVIIWAKLSVYSSSKLPFTEH